jgi:hypothetical protein
LGGSFVNIQHLWSIGTGFTSFFKFIFHQILGCRLSYFSSFNLSFLCFGITSHLLSFCSLVLVMYSFYSGSVQRMWFFSVPFLNWCPSARWLVTVTISGRALFLEYLISLSIYLSTLCSWFRLENS